MESATSKQMESLMTEEISVLYDQFSEDDISESSIDFVVKFAELFSKHKPQDNENKLEIVQGLTAFAVHIVG